MGFLGVLYLPTTQFRICRKCPNSNQTLDLPGSFPKTDLQMEGFRVNCGPGQLQAAHAYSLLDQGQIAGRALIDMGE